jgi:repressor LexA
MRQKNKLSKREYEVLVAIRNYLAHNNRLPSYREIGKNLGYDSSPQRVSYFMTRLMKKGYLTKDTNSRFTINYDFAEEQLDSFNNIETVEVPILGTIPCGPTMTVEECVEGTIKVSTEIAKKGNQYFFLRATGDSMNLAGIQEGDMLLARSQVCADNGDRVVALVDGGVTLKEFRRVDGINMLLPKSDNPKNKPIIISESCSIQGVVTQVFPSDIFPR